jgi:hypothetical protein
MPCLRSSDTRAFAADNPRKLSSIKLSTHFECGGDRGTFPAVTSNTLVGRWWQGGDSMSVRHNRREGQP